MACICRNFNELTRVVFSLLEHTIVANFLSCCCSRNEKKTKKNSKGVSALQPTRRTLILSIHVATHSFLHGNFDDDFPLSKTSEVVHFSQSKAQQPPCQPCRELVMKSAPPFFWHPLRHWIERRRQPRFVLHSQKINAATGTITTSTT